LLSGDAAVALLKEGADASIKNSAEELPLDLAPDKEVSAHDWELLFVALTIVARFATISCKGQRERE
jgi:hypothetical protein